MRDFGKDELAPRAGRGRGNAYRSRDLRVREGASMRLVAAMAEPLSSGRGIALFQGAAVGTGAFVIEPGENDAQYYRRRSTEEGRAAAEATGPVARAAHLDLAGRYARLSRRKPPSHGQAVHAEAPRKPGNRSAGLPEAERKRRLDDLLDEALLETFPASDPVSIVHVR